MLEYYAQRQDVMILLRLYQTTGMCVEGGTNDNDDIGSLIHEVKTISTLSIGELPSVCDGEEI